MDAVLYRIGDIIAAQFLSKIPLGVYGVSCLAGYRHHARRAATRSLEIKNLGRPSTEFTGMEAISAFDYHRILRYHYECGRAAQAVGNCLKGCCRPNVSEKCRCGIALFASLASLQSKLPILDGRRLPRGSQST
ncbi:hypothetical protein BDR07DRAFT_844514 [Suillus spraguei]|nr:hypothetical protein BDR07DRAFT_844514 [Suillus spraguei]